MTTDWGWEQEYVQNSLVEHGTVIVEHVEGWLKMRRDDQLPDSQGWHAIDWLLAEVRMKAANGYLPWETP